MHIKTDTLFQATFTLTHTCTHMYTHTLILLKSILQLLLYTFTLMTGIKNELTVSPAEL